MTDPTHGSIEAFLDATGKRSPTPGGGAIAALAGALAAALARMVATYSVSKKTAPEDRTAIEAGAVKLRRADELLRALIAQDAIAYEAMTRARKTAQDDADQAAAYQTSILAAVAVPMEIAGVASHALGVLHGIHTITNRYLHSDLGAAAVIAHAAADAARFMVLVNLSDLESPSLRGKLHREINASVAHCREHRMAIEGFVNSALEPA